MVPGTVQWVAYTMLMVGRWYRISGIVVGDEWQAVGVASGWWWCVECNGWYI